MATFEFQNESNNKAENENEYEATEPAARRQTFIDMKNERNGVPVTMLAQLKAKTTSIDRRGNRTGESSQVLKQRNGFKEHKENRAANQAKYIWFGIFSGTLLCILVIVVGMVMLSRRFITPGWVLIGVGVLLLTLVVILIIVNHRTRVLVHKKRIEQAALHSRQFYVEKQLCDFPPDPILRRGITNLIYHGQIECPECRLSRQKEIDGYRKESIIADEKRSYLSDHSPGHEIKNLPSRGVFLEEQVIKNASACKYYNRSAPKYNRRKSSAVSSMEDDHGDRAGTLIHIGEKYRNTRKKLSTTDRMMISTPSPSILGNRNNSFKRSSVIDHNTPSLRTDTRRPLGRIETQPELSPRRSYITMPQTDLNPDWSSVKRSFNNPILSRNPILYPQKIPFSKEEDSSSNFSEEEV